MMALVKIGFFESGIVDKNTFRAISREIESRSCLRLNSTHEILTEFQILETIGVFHEYEQPKKLTKATIQAMKACFHALRASCENSESRKRISQFKNHQSFLIDCISISTGKGKGASKPINPATFRKRKQLFLQYLAHGARLIHEQGKNKFDLASDILKNLEVNFSKN